MTRAPREPTVRRAAAAIALALTGCQQGLIADPTHPSGAVETAVDDDDVESAPISLGESRLRSLNRREYEHTVRDLFELDALPVLDLPRDHRNARGFDTDGAVAILDDAAAEQYLMAAEAVALAVRDRGISHFEACADLVDAELQGCLAGHYEPWLTRAFRSPAPGESIERLSALVSIAESHAEATEMITIFTLTSPSFLFHYKTPRDGRAATELDAFAIANRLSYLLWATLPDEELVAAARDRSLLDPDVRARHAERLLADPRAERFVTDFLTLWLNIDRLPSRAESDEEAALYADMVQETMMFGVDALQRGAIVDLLLADYSFLNARLAGHYGVDADGLEAGTFVRHALPPVRRGILTQASLLAARSPESVSDPIRRGVWTARELLCSAPDAAPPPDVDGLELASGGQTPREVLELHQTDPVCASCHRFTDPYGLALETFDAQGRHRERYENGREVDTSGELVTGESFADVYELEAIVAANGTLERCIAEHLATYGLGRMLSNRELEAVRDIVSTHLLASGADATLHDIVLGLVRSPLFVREGGAL